MVHLYVYVPVAEKTRDCDPDVKVPMSAGAPATAVNVMLCGTPVVVFVQVTVEPEVTFIDAGLKA